MLKRQITQEVQGIDVKFTSAYSELNDACQALEEVMEGIKDRG